MDRVIDIDLVYMANDFYDALVRNGCIKEEIDINMADFLENGE